MAIVKVDINEYASSQPPKVRAWLSAVDKLMRDGNCLNLDYSVNQDNYCVHGNAEVFEYNGQKSHRCPHYGWRFELIETTNFEILSRWIALEVTWQIISRPV
jgi:hypothetical protein